MCAAKKGSRKGAAKKPKSGSKKARSGGSPWPVVAALAVPLFLVGGYLVVQMNGSLSGALDGLTGKVTDFVGNLTEGHDKGAGSPDRPQLPVDRRERPVAVRPQEAPKPPADQARPPEIPRQEVRHVQAAHTPLTVKQAQAIAQTLFGGTLVASHSKPKAFWYDFELKNAHKRYPFDCPPKRVSIGTVGISGPFVKGRNGLVVLVKSHDPEGAEWVNEYAGAAFLSGSPDKPGAVLGATAMQAPRGTIPRYESIDAEGDGVLELVLEIESEAPGGYLFRDLAVHAFTSGGTVARWSARTLDDGPGVPLETARFKNVSFVDLDNDGTLDIKVDVGKRSYAINKDFSRTLKKERILATKTFRLAKGKFRLAHK